MRVSSVKIENFRLLSDVEVCLEEETTLIVGRNNCGKTSIAELFRRVSAAKGVTFALEDFSLGCHERFWTAYEAIHNEGGTQAALTELPTIRFTLDIAYDVDSPDLGPLSECIIDLDPACNHARIVLTYGPSAKKFETLFSGLPSPQDEPEQARSSLYKALRSRISTAYEPKLEAVDPNDETNRKTIEHRVLTAILKGDFINAQRGLDDDTSKEKDILGKVIEVLFHSALNDSSDLARHATAIQLEGAVEQIQEALHTQFNERLTSLLPTFELFGYPGLSNPGLVTETTFDVDKLLSNHTKVRYTGTNGVTLPETYNGLGVRNLIYMLLQLLRFFREYQSQPIAAGVHLIFIEEPEAHLHPQMQEVFIRQLNRIKAAFEEQLNSDRPWPVQFVVTTHSPHMANEASFESMRYFHSETDENSIRRSVIKDLRQGMNDSPDREFLHQYLTLTRCDLFFADKAVLIEGTSERLLLPRMIQKTDEASGDEPALASQYVTVMEVGGAYAHRFFQLLEFLELPSLIITDIDSVQSVKRKTGPKRVKTPVAAGEFTSNSCIKEWFTENVSPAQLIEKSVEEKTHNDRRIAYQVPEVEAGPCGRSFEDAFIIANPDLFNLEGQDLAESAYDFAASLKKSEFALRFAIENTEWIVPRYIAEGLRWLANYNQPRVDNPVENIAEGLVHAVAQNAAEELGDE